MDMKVEEKYNSVVIHLRGKLYGGGRRGGTEDLSV